MSEAAQAQASAAISPERDIKQERNVLEDFDFSVPQPNGSSEQPREPEAVTATEPVTTTTETTEQSATNGPAEPEVAAETEAINATEFAAQPATNGTSTPVGPAASPLTAPGSPTKRPIEDVETTIETPEAKRPKNEEQNHALPEQPQVGSDPPLEDYNEDDINLFVQNALSNINNLMDEFDPETDGQVDADGGDANAEEQAPISFIDEPSKFTHNQFLNALGNTAVAMLLLLSQKPHDSVVAKLRDADSEHRRHYIQYQKTLEALRLHYSDGSILSASDYDLRSDVAGTVIQFVNLAQLGAWLLDGSPESLNEADKNLVKVFRDDRLGLSQQIVDLMMDIKTQRTINLVQSKDDKKLSEDELQGIFMKDAEKQLEEHNITNLVHGSEKSITTSLSERVEELRNLTAEVNVAEKYAPSKLLRKFCEYANNQLAFAEQLSERLGFVRPKYEEPAQDNGPTAEDLFEFAQAFEKNTEEMIQNALAGLDDLNPPTAAANEASSAPSANGTQAEAPKINGRFTDYKDFEALVAESTSNYVRTTLQGLSPTPYQPTVPTSTTESMAAQVQNANHLNSTQQQGQQNSYYPTYPQATAEQQPQQQQHLQVPEQQPQAAQGHTLPPHQSCSSAQLYEKARQAALSRSTAHTRREGLHSTRRPWTQEEEKALMTGLDMVKGPHWSQILSLFGVNGSITDILRDRTQVQLKDKARNLKLFFLKTNSEMPYYLNTVTGELKTRAPTQAARKEAEDRARQASVEGLVNGVHQSPHNRTQSAGVITPAHAAAAAAAQRNSLPHSSPPQITYTQSSQATTPNGAGATAQQHTQGYATHAQNQVAQAHSQQPHVPTQEPQPQTQQPITDGLHGSSAGHHDQAVKDEPQHDLQAFDEQSIIEQLQRVTQDFPLPLPQDSEPGQRFPSPAADNTSGTQQSPAPGTTTTATPSQPQSQQQHAPTPTQPQQVSPSPAPTQTAPSNSATPAPPVATAQPEAAPVAIALPQAAPTKASEPQPAEEVPAQITEQAENMPQDNAELGTEDDVVGFDPAALMRDLEAVM